MGGQGGFTAYQDLRELFYLQVGAPAYKLVLRGRGGGDQDRRTEGHGKDLHETCGAGWKVGPALPVEIGARVP